MGWTRPASLNSSDVSCPMGGRPPILIAQVSVPHCQSRKRPFNEFRAPRPAVPGRFACRRRRAHASRVSPKLLVRARQMLGFRGGTARGQSVFIGTLENYASKTSTRQKAGPCRKSSDFWSVCRIRVGTRRLPCGRATRFGRPGARSPAGFGGTGHAAALPPPLRDTLGTRGVGKMAHGLAVRRSRREMDSVSFSTPNGHLRQE